MEAQLDRYLIYLFQDRGFSLSRPVTGHSPATSVRRGLASPSSTLLVPPISSLCPNANGGIGPHVIESSDWLTLRLPHTNQMWKGESTKV